MRYPKTREGHDLQVLQIVMTIVICIILAAFVITIVPKDILLVMVAAIGVTLVISAFITLVIFAVQFVAHLFKKS